jgi:hypothetical protein
VIWVVDVSSYAIGIGGYCVLLAVIGLLIFASHRSGSRVTTGGRLIASIRASRTGRVVLVLVWWWVGWHLFVR